MLIALFTYNMVIGQNITITDDQSHTPDSSAMLDIFSTHKGLLIPRLTSDQVNNISDPATGLLVYNNEENTFLYYTGAEWLKLSAGNPDSFWVQDDSLAYLADTNLHFGIGTRTPVGKLEVWGDASIGNDEPLFEVKDKDGNSVFAVFHDGAVVYVDESAKGNIGGFAVSGRSASKVTGDYMRVTKDSVRIYIDTNTTKGNIGGFAVSGRSATKASGDNNIFLATPDSTRIYVKESTTKGNIGGFAVSGRSASKGEENNLFNVSGDETAQIINPSRPGLLWYPKREALLSGRVLIEHPDSVGMNSMATGFESKAIGDASQAMGYQCITRGQTASALGKNAIASGENSFSLGNGTVAMGNSAFAFGEMTVAEGNACLAIGARERDSTGTIGRKTSASGIASMALGVGSVVNGISNAAIGIHTTAVGSFGSGAVGPFCSSTAMGAIAIGFADSVAGKISMALGSFNFCGDSASVALGSNNHSNGLHSMAIGSFNESIGMHSLALGFNNFISGSYGVSIGVDNVVDGESSIVMGDNASDNGHPGCFVFSDPTPANPMNPEERFLADAPNQFKVKATGGAMFVVGYGGPGEVIGVQLTDGSGWQQIGTKKNAKTIKDIDEENCLQKLADMPLQKSFQIGENGETARLMPYAEDFYNAFGLGDSPGKMSYLDLDGVSFAAIKALEKRTNNLQNENKQLIKENKQLRKEIEEIKAMIEEMGK